MKYYPLLRSKLNDCFIAVYITMDEVPLITSMAKETAYELS